MSAPLDILSAASYPDILPDDRPVSTHSSTSPLFGGILLYTDGEEVTASQKARPQKPHASAGQEKQAQPKKETMKKPKSRDEKGTENGTESTAKKRGRPRVDTADETAAEVRQQSSLCYPHTEDEDSVILIGPSSAVVHKYDLHSVRIGCERRVLFRR